MWQDYIISIVGFLFGFMLFPQIRDAWHGRAMNGWTSGLTTVGLIVLAICFGSLELWISFAGEVFVASCWALVWFLGIVKNV